MLRRLQTHGIGPARDMQLDFGERLNVLTGDNGLGKSFVLDLVWWVLTGSWAGPTALPSGQSPQIAYEGRDADAVEERGSASFDFVGQVWRWNSIHARAPRGSVVYVGAERIATFVKDRNVMPQSIVMDSETAERDDDAFRFRAHELWDGKRDAAGHYVCNGLIRDLVDWMRSRSVPGSKPEHGMHPFEAFERVLRVLSPPGGPALKLGPPRRVFVKDSREIPTLITPWDEEPIPIPLAAAGIRRVIELAYLLVWTWREHLEVTKLMRLVAQRELFILIDEPELHLHPRWQRSILPALADVAKQLESSLAVQLFVTTHSPLLLASGALLADEGRDRLFHFDTRHGAVTIDELEWVKHGDAVGWLTSEVFGFERGDSLEAERAVRLADAYMDGRLDELPEKFRDKYALDAELRRVLAASDPFWARWFVRSDEDVAE